MASSIDSHPQRQKIIDAILAGRTLRDIAASVTPKPGLMALQRYRAKVVAPALANAGQLTKVLHGQGLNPTEVLSNPETLDVTRAALRASPLMERHQFLWETTVEGIERAKSAVRVVRDKKTGELLPVGEDVTAIAPLLNQAHKNLEILGEVTGELRSAQQGPTVAIQIVCPAGTQQPTIQAEDNSVTIDIGSK